ncbi:GNAT family N-acetyltransferase [Citrobacter sedlakii]|uniref:GNAT family N-acetyltransferase n=1 Tax=Citrobacter sedlakii TaxID=67826 RepID=UPI002B23A804|nr:GNAT family N-acetyltransferase [Citrobacter sedlakii]MEB0952097.1 GNAT family N-acetyltransferase [Citrobacter sedlakii]
MKIHCRPTTLADTAGLPAIERSAGRRFLAVPELAWIADDTIMTVEQHREYVLAGMSWLAETDGHTVGFLLAEAQESSLYIAEFSLHLDWQGKGIGRQLLNVVRQWADEQGYTAMTLTTFRDVAWNAPLYARLGFEMLDEDSLPAALRQKREAETARGIARGSRCAMRLRLR